MRAFGIVALFTGVCVLASPAAFSLGVTDQDRSRPPGGSEVPQPAKELPQAFITSKRVVYGYGQPIDLTFSIATPKDGKVLPDFKIERVPRLSEPGVNDEPVIAEPRAVNGLHFWQAPGESFDGKEREGALPAGQTYTETIADLREWYDLDAPGTYRVTFGGEWIDAEDERHAVTSNAIIVRIARPPSEEEPFGEPTEGSVISLSEIWALRMPGTKPMDPSFGGPEGVTPNAPEGRYLNEMIRAFKWHQVSYGFAVPGTGLEALRHAHAVMVEEQPQQSRFRRGEQISIVFFSKGYTRPTHLREVRDHGSLVDLSFEFAWGDRRYLEQVSRPTLALIPITPTAVGDVRVEMNPIINWSDHHQIRPDSIPRYISQSFTFQVAP